MIFVGDDWSEEHHDVYLMDEGGKRLTSRRLPDGLVGIRQLHELIATHAEDPEQVVVGIETDRGLWVGRSPVPAIRCLRSTRWRWPATVIATTSRVPNRMPLMPNCWPIWCAPTGTIIAASPAIAPMPRRSRCSPARIRT